MLQSFIQNLEPMFNEQKEYVTAVRGEHDRQIMKQKRIAESGDAQNVNSMLGCWMRMVEMFGSNISLEDLQFSVLGQDWDQIVQVICLFKENRSLVTTNV